MTGSFYRCDGTYCSKQEDTEVIPAGWIAVSVTDYAVQYAPSDKVAHFCDWQCLASWAYTTATTTTAEATLAS